MPTTSPGYSITIRAEAPSAIGSTADLAGAVTAAGGSLTALDVVESSPGLIVVDVTCNAVDGTHADQVTASISALPGVTVRKVSDRTFLLHLGGKLEVVPKVPLKHRDDLSRAYTPGVARVCLAIAKNPADARRLTIKRNTVAVVTDGSAVLGLGDIGPAAALPVMEGKAALFKQFGGVDAWPVVLDTQNVDLIVEIVRCIAPQYGGINLEDISAPRCFEVERRLRDVLDIPVFRADQHGTAIIGCDRHGAVRPDNPNLDEFRRWIADYTNPRGARGTLAEMIVDADVFIGVSAPNLLTGQDISRMVDNAIVFALANPDPEVDPFAASQHAAIVATGRSDYPNQINNVLAFPGFFRGMLDADARDITDACLLAAAGAIADCVAPTELNPNYIVPSVFDPAAAPAVAAAVRQRGRR